MFPELLGILYTKQYIVPTFCPFHFALALHCSGISRVQDSKRRPEGLFERQTQGESHFGSLKIPGHPLQKSVGVIIVLDRFQLV